MSMQFVPDATVVLKWYLRDEDLLAEADRFLVDWQQHKIVLIAPIHLVAEVSHALRRAVRRGRLTMAEAERGQGVFARQARRITFMPNEGVIGEALQLAAALGISFYDACYLQVARMQGISMVTADERIIRQAGHLGNLLSLADPPQAVT